MSDDTRGLAEDMGAQIHRHHSVRDPEPDEGEGTNGNGRMDGGNVLLLPGDNGHCRAPDISLSPLPVVAHGAFPPYDVEAIDWAPPQDGETQRRPFRMRSLGDRPAQAPVLRLAAVVAPIAVVLLTSIDGLGPLRFFGLLSLLSSAWLVMHHASTASARLSPFAVGVWAPSLVGAINGAIATAAIALMVRRLGVELPQILLMFGGVFAATCLVEALEVRLGRRTRLLLVGASDGAVDLLHDLARNRKLPFEWIGAVTEEVPAGGALPIPMLGTLADLPTILPTAQPDLVVFADVEQRDRAIDHLVGMANLGFRIVGVPEIYEYALGRVPIRHLPPAWFMSLMHLYQRPYSRVVGRMFDMTLAGVGMLVAAPFFALIAALVRCTSHGPVFFRQERVGEGGRPFQLVKFRTMVDGAENGKAVWAAERDNRITAVGRFLRTTRLDELPQLWNVLCGNMSIIGPRPERPEFLELLEREVPFWARRLLIKPGITGWAQVQGGYAADTVGAANKLSYDLYYLKHRSMWLNFAIFAKTAATVLSRSGAR